MTILRTKAQEAAMRVFQETLKRVAGDALIRSSCWREGDHLYVAGSQLDLSRFERVFVLAAGKASCAMASGFEQALDGHPHEGLAITKHGHAAEGLTKSVEILEAGHPIPDENSLAAGRRMLDLASTAGAGDLVVVLISGGASSLMEVLPEGVELGDFQAVTEGLLRSGADIRELNTVRCCLSEIKAGGLARASGEAQVVCLLLSDVIGNPREFIGSGPCWGAPPAPAEAVRVLEERRIEIPPSVRKALARPVERTPVYPEHVVVGDIYTLLEAALATAESLGLKPRVYGRTFSGEARDVGARMAAEALSLGRDEGKIDCIIAAGETTVTVRGKGLGGRNQELACAAAIALEDVPDVALLAVGTDGTDGPTDAAGGLVDGQTYKRANLRRALDENDCYRALEAADALVVTGPTQTNLNDLVVIARVPEEG